MTENVVGMHGTRDFTEVMKGLAGIHRNEVSGDAIAESVTDRLKGSFGCTERFEVAQVGDDELVPLIVGAVPLEKSLS